jgi:catechol 2,3-dioxygenase-like lactoylglutathione lyase family enzyme
MQRVDAQSVYRPQVRGIDHVVLRVSDLARALVFYRDVLGCTVEVARETIGLWQLRAGRAMIDLVPVTGKLGAAGGAPPGPEGRNVDHICLRIEPFDEPSLRAHLARHGIDAGATESRIGAEGVGPSIYISDPDGNVIELKGPPA